MTRFTDNPLESMMMKKPGGGSNHSRRLEPLPPTHPCHGCGNAGQHCVGICQREMNQFLKRRRTKNEV
ncbi:hypothetical protein [Eisenbergiella porci]|uniref:hypothetical protein n=1 Tax=Eisenbergiella porci TaxID=2652274 RepID=UPI0022E0C6D0|nr:hypothetical protein [Eisenbergiella porci]